MFFLRGLFHLYSTFPLCYDNPTLQKEESSMKKTLALGLSLCLCLSGCSAPVEEESSSLVTQSKPSGGGLAADVANQKAAYYQQLVTDLEAELLSLKTQLYEERVRYEAQIDALEDAMKPVSGEAKSDFQYTVTDGKVTLQSYVGESATVTIPTSIDGCPVVAIGDRAFENCHRLTEVIVPEGIQSIGWFAFSGCIALTSVTLPKSLSVVQYGAFLNCPSAMTISCPKNSYARAYAESYGIAVR